MVILSLIVACLGLILACVAIWLDVRNKKDMDKRFKSIGDGVESAKSSAAHLVKVDGRKHNHKHK